MSVIENWYNLSPQERKEHYEMRKSKINEMIETLKKNKELLKQEQKEKEVKLNETKKEEKKKKNRTSFNYDIVLRKDFRISPKTKKYFSGENDIFLDQKGDPMKENYEKESLIIPNRVMYQKKKIILTDPKYNLDQAKFMLEQIEANLGYKPSSQYSQNEYHFQPDQFQSIQQNESFLPMINQPPQTRSQNIRQIDRSAPFSRQNPFFGEQNQGKRYQGEQYYSPQDRQKNDQGQMREDNIFSRNNQFKDNHNYRNKYINENSTKNDLIGYQNNYSSVPNINYNNLNRQNNYQRDYQLPNQNINYYQNRNNFQPISQKLLLNQHENQNISQPTIKNNYSIPVYQYQQQPYQDY